MKKLLIFSLMFICSIVVSTTVALAGEWLTAPNGAKIWDAHPVSGETITWSGGVDNNGYAAGTGVAQWYQDGIAGDTYTGQMLNGRWHGKGTYKWANGDVSKGDWVDGVFQNSAPTAADWIQVGTLIYNTAKGLQDQNDQQQKQIQQDGQDAINAANQKAAAEKAAKQQQQNKNTSVSNNNTGNYGGENTSSKNTGTYGNNNNGGYNNSNNTNTQVANKPTDTHKYVAGGVYTHCMEIRHDKNYVYVKNICSETIHVSVAGVGDAQSCWGAGDIKPGVESMVAGGCRNANEDNSRLYACPEHYVAVDANNEHSNHYIGPFRCKSN